MDPTKPSLSTKAQIVNSAGGNEALMEEAAAPRRDAVDGDRQRDTESRDTADAVDGTAAEINHSHRGSADKHKFNTLGYQRRTKQKVVTDFATGNKGPSAGTKPRAALRQVLFSQGVSEKNPASEGQLDVLKQELGSFAVPLNLKWKWKEESQGTALEKNWMDIVFSHSTMSKMQRHQQEALWEFVHTELTYINKLIIIRDLVIAALVNLHQHGFLQEVTPELLFSNLPSILKAHQLFWQEVIYPMLQDVRRTGKPFDPMMLEAGCLQFHERFPSYQHYCWEEENNLEFSRRQMESNLHFLTFVQWVESHPQCDRMRLGDMQAKPHQRITKYPLLLKAVLKTTQDPHVQHTLRGMLSSVNSFLESINDYLRLKDEELALSISAQRVEGYEVEGINEDIDRHVREICQFDLTCPIRGVGPDVVRKLLLEDSLKIRGRKDSKLEVVALLFSDVLLMTKAQKKGERLKVVRPPLALDRSFCIPLKDGCSFVLVEVGELRSARNVYIFAASTSESCSTWVTTIHQAKETLWSLRQMESNRQLENLKIRKPVAKPVTEAKKDDMETEPAMQPTRETFVDEVTEELIIPQAINGILASRDAEERYRPPAAKVTNSPAISFWNPQLSINNRKPVPRSPLRRQQSVKGHEWIEMRNVRGEEVRFQREEEEKRNHWNHRAQSAPNLDQFIHGISADPSRYNTTGPPALLYPDVDYPMDENCTFHSYERTVSREGPGFFRPPEEGGISTNRKPQSVDQDFNKHIFYSHSEGSQEKSSEVWGCSKNLKSPGLRRRRPSSTHQAHSSPTPGQTPGPQHLNSASDSHRVLKLGSLKMNQGMFWGMPDRDSPDPQTVSESELNDLNVRVKTQRSASIPNIVIEGGHELRLHSSSLYNYPQAEGKHHPITRHHSTLEGLLNRAKVRDRDVKKTNLRSFSATPSPSPSPSEGDRDTEWEEEVEVMRHRALTVSEGWKEQLVDGDEDDRSNSVIFTDGVNVDWSGWCFDDDEVMDHLNPGGEGLMEGISRSLAFWEIHGLSEQEDGEYSQV